METASTAKTMKIGRVRRNACKKIVKIFANAHNVSVWTLYGGSEGSTAEQAQKMLSERSSAYLYHCGVGKYSVHVDGNHFYSFMSVEV